MLFYSETLTLEGGQEVVERWYKKDANCLPTTYILQGLMQYTLQSINIMPELKPSVFRIRFILMGIRGSASGNTDPYLGPVPDPYPTPDPTLNRFKFFFLIFFCERY